MNVIPSQVPASGPNFFNFDDEVVYALHFDLDADGDARGRDRSSFGSTPAIRAPFDDLPVSYAGVDRCPVCRPRITALDGPGSEGLGLRQKYSVRILVQERRRAAGVLGRERRGQRRHAHRRAVERGRPDHARTTRRWRRRASSSIAGNAHPGVRRTAQGDLLDRSGVRRSIPSTSGGTRRSSPMPRTPATRPTPSASMTSKGSTSIPSPSRSRSPRCPRWSGCMPRRAGPHRSRSVSPRWRGWAIRSSTS